MIFLSLWFLGPEHRGPYESDQTTANAGLLPTCRAQRHRVRCNLKNGRFTLWKKPMIVKAVFPVAADGGGCRFAVVRPSAGDAPKRERQLVAVPASQDARRQCTGNLSPSRRRQGDSVRRPATMASWASRGTRKHGNCLRRCYDVQLLSEGGHEPHCQWMGIPGLHARGREGATAVRRTEAKRSPEALGRPDGDAPKGVNRRNTRPSTCGDEARRPGVQFTPTKRESGSYFFLASLSR